MECWYQLQPSMLSSSFQKTAWTPLTSRKAPATRTPMLLVSTGTPAVRQSTAVNCCAAVAAHTWCIAACPPLPLPPAGNSVCHYCCINPRYTHSPLPLPLTLPTQCDHPHPHHHQRLPSTTASKTSATTCRNARVPTPSFRTITWSTTSTTRSARIPGTRSLSSTAGSRERCQSTSLHHSR